MKFSIIYREFYFVWFSGDCRSTRIASNRRSAHFFICLMSVVHSSICSLSLSVYAKAAITAAAQAGALPGFCAVIKLPETFTCEPQSAPATKVAPFQINDQNGKKKRRRK